MAYWQSRNVADWCRIEIVGVINQHIWWLRAWINDEGSILMMKPKRMNQQHNRYNLPKYEWLIETWKAQRLKALISNGEKDLKKNIIIITLMPYNSYMSLYMECSKKRKKNVLHLNKNIFIIKNIYKYAKFSNVIYTTLFESWTNFSCIVLNNSKC